MVAQLYWINKIPHNDTDANHADNDDYAGILKIVSRRHCRRRHRLHLG